MDANMNTLDKQKAIGPYTATITGAMVGLGQAVALAMNLRDRPVIEEMQRVCADIFEQAEEAMNSDTRNIQ